MPLTNDLWADCEHIQRRTMQYWHNWGDTNARKSLKHLPIESHAKLHLSLVQPEESIHFYTLKYSSEKKSLSEKRLTIRNWTKLMKWQRNTCMHSKPFKREINYECYNDIFSEHHWSCVDGFFWCYCLCNVIRYDNIAHDQMTIFHFGPILWMNTK